MNFEQEVELAFALIIVLLFLIRIRQIQLKRQIDKVDRLTRFLSNENYLYTFMNISTVSEHIQSELKYLETINESFDKLVEVLEEDLVEGDEDYYPIEDLAESIGRNLESLIETTRVTNICLDVKYKIPDKEYQTEDNVT